MNKKSIFVIFLILIISVVISISSISIKNENSILNKEVTNLKEKNADLENTIAALNSKVKEQELNIDMLKKFTFNKTDNMYPIYTADIDTYERKIDAYFYIPKNTPLKQKLQTLAKVLSESYFDNLPIQIVKIEKINDKTVAIVNLSESVENQGVTDYKKLKGNTWMTHYMQGSTGGTITSTRLIETLLQREYSGQWVDGVKFLYNNGICDYQHAADLSDVNYK